MSTYKDEAFVGQAIESVLNQSYTDIEFLIILDKPIDRTAEIVLSYKDDRIRIIENEQNLGLTISLNKGLKIARGEFLARIDADDICTPGRLEEQLAFFEQHPDVAVCGGYFEFIESGEVIRFPLDHDAIKLELFRSNALCHSSVMFRTALLRDKGLVYDEHFTFAQDYNLWSRAIQDLKFANLNEILVRFRRHAGQISIEKAKEQQGFADETRLKQLENLGIIANEKEKATHLKLIKRETLENIEEYKYAMIWVEQLMDHNEQSAYFDGKLFGEFCKGLAHDAGRNYFIRKKYSRQLIKDLYNKEAELYRQHGFLGRLGIIIKSIIGWRASG